MSDPGMLTPRPSPEDAVPRTADAGPSPSRNGPATGAHASNGQAARAERLQRVALDAHADMEAYRRVLAAAVANEKSALARTEESRREAESVRGELSKAALSRGLAEGRVQELERERAALEDRAGTLERELARVRERAQADQARATDELDRTRSRVAFLEAQLDSLRQEQSGFSFTALRLRSRALLVGAIACYLLALGFFVQMLLALLASSVPPLELLALTLALFLGGALLHGRAAHELADELDGA